MGDLNADGEWHEPRFRSDLVARCIAGVGSDSSVVQAAQVSVVGATERDDDGGKAGLINYLMRERHGSPFEHNSLTFYINAPIFVAREFMRHRIGWSYNELSGRYSELPADFYLPSVDRPLVNAGTSAKPELVPGELWQYSTVERGITRTAKVAWEEYQWMLKSGVAREVARSVLPVTVYTEFYATCNARSLMSFLSLRTQHSDATYVSRPQLEIAHVADQMEAVFADRFPLVHAAYVKHGRVGA